MISEKRRGVLKWTLLLVLFFPGCTNGPAGNSEQQLDPGDISGTVRLFEPVKPIAELRAAALEAEPPFEEGDFLAPDLVEVSTLDPSIKLDVRYATDDNFIGAAVYESPRIFLQRPVAEALLDAHLQLREKGYGLVVFDGYRPWYVTRIFWDATPEDKKEFVADPEKGSRHNRGAAVDVSLYDLSSGDLLPMPSGFDETTERAAVEYTGGDARSRANRDLLIATMRQCGFEPLANEWWHFDHQSWKSYPIMNVEFAKVE